MPVKIIKFIDSNNKIRSIFFDESIATYKKQLIKGYSEIYGPIFEEKIEEFVETLPESEFKILEKGDKKTDVIFRSTKLMRQYCKYLETNYPENRSFLLSGEWDNNAFLKNDNRSYNDPGKRVTVSAIAKLAEQNNLKKALIEPGSDVSLFTFYGLKKDVESFLPKLGKIMQEGKLQNKKQNKVVIQENESKIANLNEDKKTLEENIEEAENDLNIITSPKEKAETQKYIDKNKKMISNILKQIEKCNEEIKNVTEGHEYTTSDIKKELKMVIEPCVESDIEVFDKVTDAPNASSPYVPNPFNDSIKKGWFNNPGIKFIPNFEKTKIIKDNKVYDYFKVEEALKKVYNNSRSQDSFEKWLEKSSKIIPHVLDGLKPINATKDVMLGTTPELLVEMSYARLSELNDCDLKEMMYGEDGYYNTHRSQIFQVDYKEKEPLFVQEWFDDFVEWYEEKTGKKFIHTEDEKNIESKDSKIKRKEKDTNMKDALKNKKFRFSDGTIIEVLESDGKTLKEVRDEAINVHKQLLNKKKLDSVEKKSEDAYEVVVNGKVIGVYDTLEEAEEAEKRALESIEKGIPKPLQDFKKRK